ncbi:MAG: hypothetical protein P1V97_37120 [Planctomycetota bacterium]|nr:hypothetical protein [Planctomycetota bacterium]
MSHKWILLLMACLSLCGSACQSMTIPKSVKVAKHRTVWTRRPVVAGEEREWRNHLVDASTISVEDMARFIKLALPEDAWMQAGGDFEVKGTVIRVKQTPAYQRRIVELIKRFHKSRRRAEVTVTVVSVDRGLANKLGPLAVAGGAGDDCHFFKVPLSAEFEAFLTDRGNKELLVLERNKLAAENGLWVETRHLLRSTYLKSVDFNGRSGVKGGRGAQAVMSTFDEGYNLAVSFLSTGSKSGLLGLEMRVRKEVARSKLRSEAYGGNTSLDLELPLFLNYRARDIVQLKEESLAILCDAGGERVILYILTPRF